MSEANWTQVIELIKYALGGLGGLIALSLFFCGKWPWEGLIVINRHHRCNKCSKDEDD